MDDSDLAAWRLGERRESERVNGRKGDGATGRWGDRAMERWRDGENG